MVDLPLCVRCGSGICNRDLFSDILCCFLSRNDIAFSVRQPLFVSDHSRRFLYDVVMENGAKGASVSVSGKLRAQRAKTMKFTDGYMISSGHPVKEYVDSAYCHVKLRQGVLGIKVKIMLPHDPTGKIGPKDPLPDVVTVIEAKEESFPTTAASTMTPSAPVAV